MPRKRRFRQLEAVADINITPLMDLTFLLLIVFMITAPMLQYGLDVSPPEMDAAPADLEQGVTITVDKKGGIRLQDQPLELGSLAGQMRSLAQTRPGVSLFVRADGDRPYREVIGIMKEVRDAGIQNVTLVTEPEGKSAL